MLDSNQTAAVVAASQASEAVSELLRYAREGDGMPRFPFGSQDPVSELAQAIVTAADIERLAMEALAEAEPQYALSDEIEMLGRLAKACREFVVDRSGGAAECPYFADHSTDDAAIRSAIAQGRKIVFPVPYAPTRRSPEERR